MVVPVSRFVPVLVLAAALLQSEGAMAYYSAVYADIAWGAGGDRVWTALPQGSGQINSLAAMSSSTDFSTLDGYNVQYHYNPDFASASSCAAAVPGTGQQVTVRKYGCRYLDSYGYQAFAAVPVTDEGPIARARGWLTVTDNSMTGTLNIVSSTDEPTAATTTFLASGVRVSNSIGSGLDGYNYRTADGSPFGNAWNGITAAATLQLNLTGAFSSASFMISGGTARFTDPGFACQQGRISNPDDVLCRSSVRAGGFSGDGGHLSWGWDLDGAATGITSLSELQVRNAAGTALIATLGGVFAETVTSRWVPFPSSVSGGMVVQGVAGEFRRGVGMEGCAASLRWDGSQLTCGTLVVGRVGACFTSFALDQYIPTTLPPSGCDPVALVLAPVPVPPALALLASALGVLGAVRLSKKARTDRGSDRIEK